MFLAMASTWSSGGVTGGVVEGEVLSLELGIRVIRLLGIVIPLDLSNAVDRVVDRVVTCIEFGDAEKNEAPLMGEDESESESESESVEAVEETESREQLDSDLEARSSADT